jgi:hypothetical protein
MFSFKKPPMPTRRFVGGLLQILNNKFQIPNIIQITMTKIQNPIVGVLVIGNCNLIFISSLMLVI